MQKLFREIDLQFFAGEGASPADGAAPAGAGVLNAAADAGQKDTLETMGVPTAEIRKYRASKAREAQPPATSRPEGLQEDPSNEQDAAAFTEAPKQEGQAKSLKDALKENEAWNREAQAMVRDRLSKTNGQLDKAMQILGLIGRDYGLDAEDPGKMDLDELLTKVEGDKRRFEKAAIEHGTDVDTEMRLEKLQRENKAQKRALDEQQRDTELRNHYMTLQQQAAELRKAFPDFDLDRELQNREFYERTLPGGRDTVESAFYAIHGKEIAQRQAQQAASAAARGTSQAMANSIRAGQKLPQENGTVARAPGNIQNKRFSEMSPSERKAWEREAMKGKRFN